MPSVENRIEDAEQFVSKEAKEAEERAKQAEAAVAAKLEALKDEAGEVAEHVKQRIADFEQRVLHPNQAVVRPANEKVGGETFGYGQKAEPTPTQDVPTQPTATDQTNS